MLDISHPSGQAKGKALTRKGKRLFHPIRLALTGSMSGPDIGGQLALLQAGKSPLYGAIVRRPVASQSCPRKKDSIHRACQD